MTGFAVFVFAVCLIGGAAGAAAFWERIGYWSVLVGIAGIWPLLGWLLLVGKYDWAFWVSVTMCLYGVVNRYLAPAMAKRRKGE